MILPNFPLLGGHVLRRLTKDLKRYNLADSNDMWQMDYRTQDLSQLDLRNSLGDLLNALFDDRTVWPAASRMPVGFDWRQIMELGKNPGLGIRKLHKQVIAGKNVGIASSTSPCSSPTRNMPADCGCMRKSISIQKALQKCTARR